MKFIVDVRDYEAGRTDRDLTTVRIERAVQAILDRDDSDGIVIVTREASNGDD
jgi:hypothetical protein